MSDHNVAWVAKGPIPPKAPPPSAAGPVHWAKENLFQGPVNTIITLICTVFIVLAVWAVARWALVDAVFIADSLKEYREIDPDGGASGEASQGASGPSAGASRTAAWFWDRAGPARAAAEKKRAEKSRKAARKAKTS